MRLTKLGHACVRLEKDGGVLVIDPGAFSGDNALDGADAVLVTHEHFDHVVPDSMRAALAAQPGLRLWAPAPVAEQFAEFGDRVKVTAHGAEFTAAGFGVHVYGSEHAVIHPDIPTCANVGFLVDGEVFHPGDSYTVPEDPRRHAAAAGQRAVAQHVGNDRLRPCGGPAPRVHHPRGAAVRDRAGRARHVHRPRRRAARRQVHPAGARYLGRPLTCR